MNHPSWINVLQCDVGTLMIWMDSGFPSSLSLTHTQRSLLSTAGGAMLGLVLLLALSTGLCYSAGTGRMPIFFSSQTITQHSWIRSLSLSHTLYFSFFSLSLSILLTLNPCSSLFFLSIISLFLFLLQNKLRTDDDNFWYDPIFSAKVYIIAEVMWVKPSKVHLITMTPLFSSS